MRFVHEARNCCVMVDSLLALVVYLLIIGLVLWLIDYVAGIAPLPPPFRQAVRVVVAVIGVILLIYLLLGLVGAPPGPRLNLH
jgi:VIT1/CCC1 family predicted Fe2+/Mn2+ transporter